jgi:nitrite reductase/ring-hydroxylating ferredoxin subunit
VIFHIQDEFFAMADVCTHDDGPLGDGMLEDHQVFARGMALDLMCERERR